MRERNVFLLFLVALFVVASVATVALVNHEMKKAAMDEAVDKARLILDRNMATHTYFSQDMKPHIFAWSDPFRSEEYFDPTWMSSTYAVRSIDEYFRTLNPAAYYYKECAVNARSPQNEADDEERSFIAAMNSDPTLDIWWGTRTIDGQPFFVVMRKGEVVEPSCLRCHGNPSDAPRDLIKLYGDSRSFGRRVGEAASAISIRIPLGEALEKADSFSIRLSALLVAVLVILFCTYMFLSDRMVVKPLIRIRHQAMEIAEKEQRLAAAEAEKALILNNMAEMVLLYDLNQCLLYANRASETFLGKNPEHLMGLHCTDIFHRGDETCKQCPIARAISTGEVQEEERPLEDGRTWVVRAMPIRNERNEVVNILQMVRDITERRKAQKALKENLEFLQELIDSIPNPIFYQNLEGIYLGCNKSYQQFLNRSKEEIVGKTVDQLAPPDLAEKCKAADISLLNRGGSVQFEYTCQKPHELPRNLLVNKALLSRSDGSPGGIVGTVVDMTEIKRLGEQLRHAQKMEAIGTLAGGIAHDFNNILAVVMGYAEILLMNHEDGTKDSRCLREIVQATHRAKDLVRQILSFSRRTDMERRPLQIGSVVKEIMKLLRATLPTTIEINQEIESSSLVMGNPTEIHQVVMNLCTNAYQAMTNQRGILKVSLKDIDLGDTRQLDFHDLPVGRYVQLTISDTGTGIDPAIRERIFDPYFTTKPPGEGTGLGLAIVHGIVMSYGGAVQVESEPGKGTSFHIYLSVIDQGPSDTASTQRETIVRGTERVLLVDDEEQLVSMGKIMLELIGYKVIIATSSEEAFRLVDSDPEAFDVVITDMTMPHMTGIELAKNIQAVREDLPIVLCSGYRDVIDVESSKTFGVRACLGKPLSIESLAATLRKVLDNVSE